MRTWEKRIFRWVFNVCVLMGRKKIDFAILAIGSMVNYFPYKSTKPDEIYWVYGDVIVSKLTDSVAGALSYYETNSFLEEQFAS